jgi:Ca2+-binding RTX toxin-like protein
VFTTVPLTRRLIVLGLALVAFVGLADEADAAAVKAAIKKEVLTVTGTPEDDSVSLRLKAADPDTLEVDVGADGSAEFSFDRKRFKAITVDGAGGRDSLVTDQSNGPFTDTEVTTLSGGDGGDTLIGGFGADKLLGGAGDDFVDGNQGSDTISLGDGADVVQWDPGDGSDTAIGGGTGADRLAFNGSGATESFELSPAAGGHVRLFRDVANITLDLDDVEVAELRAFGGPDTLNVADLAGTDLTEVRTDLALLGGGDDGQIDSVVVNGTAGDDTVTVGADGTAVVAQGLAATVRITGANPTVDRLTVNGLAGDDTITATPEAEALILVTVAQ